MNPSKKTIQLSKMKKAVFILICLGSIVVLFVTVAELVLRAKGIKPWRMADASIQVDPGGKFFRKHPTLGYTHIPGSFTVTLDSNFSFKVTHLHNTLRTTRPTDIHEEPGRKEEIWIFGCSYTHGWCLNDEDTFPWLLQKRLPECSVINFGVNGYGTIHSLIQFQEALKANTPEIAVLVYAIFHDKRNTFSRKRRKDIVSWNHLGPLVQPYVRLDKEGKLQYFNADVEYTVFPLMRNSALAHFIEMQYNELQLEWHKCHAVSEALIVEMARLAEKQGVKFIVANIFGGHKMQDFMQRNKIPFIDIAVDLDLPENTARPHDRHPSALANMEYASRLERYLRTEFLE